jgi:hypothetical protein
MRKISPSLVSVADYRVFSADRENTAGAPSVGEAAAFANGAVRREPGVASDKAVARVRGRKEWR